MPAKTVFELQLQASSRLNEYLTDYNIAAITNDDPVNEYFRVNLTATAVFITDVNLLVLKVKRYLRPLNKELRRYDLSASESNKRVGKGRRKVDETILKKRIFDLAASVQILNEDLVHAQANTKARLDENLKLKDELTETNSELLLYKKQVDKYYNLISKQHILSRFEVRKVAWPAGYVFFGLDPITCTLHDLDKAKRLISFAFHPDKSNPLFQERDKNIFQIINNAYDVAYDAANPSSDEDSVEVKVEECEIEGIICEQCGIAIPPRFKKCPNCKDIKK